MEVLLEHGADINKAGSVGDRPLHLACGKGYVRVTQLLVEGIKQQKADGKECFCSLLYINTKCIMQL